MRLLPRLLIVEKQLREIACRENEEEKKKAWQTRADAMNAPLTTE